MPYSRGIRLLHFEIEIDCSLYVKPYVKPLRKITISAHKLLSISFFEGGIDTSSYKCGFKDLEKPRLLFYSLNVVKLEPGCYPFLLLLYSHYFLP